VMKSQLPRTVIMSMVNELYNEDLGTKPQIAKALKDVEYNRDKARTLLYERVYGIIR